MTEGDEKYKLTMEYIYCIFLKWTYLAKSFIILVFLHPRN